MEEIGREMSKKKERERSAVERERVRINYFGFRNKYGVH